MSPVHCAPRIFHWVPDGSCPVLGLRLLLPVLGNFYALAASVLSFLFPGRSQTCDCGNLRFTSACTGSTAQALMGDTISTKKQGISVVVQFLLPVLRRWNCEAQASGTFWRKRQNQLQAVGLHSARYAGFRKLPGCREPLGAKQCVPEWEVHRKVFVEMLGCQRMVNTVVLRTNHHAGQKAQLQRHVPMNEQAIDSHQDAQPRQHAAGVSHQNEQRHTQYQQAR